MLQAPILFDQPLENVNDEKEEVRVQGVALLEPSPHPNHLPGTLLRRAAERDNRPRLHDLAQAVPRDDVERLCKIQLRPID